jgi:hypothetical protein
VQLGGWSHANLPVGPPAPFALNLSKGRPPFALSLSKGSAPFALSLSKGTANRHQGFDKLSPNGV